MARVFAHGGLRLVLLSLLEDGPKHGYELIVAMEDRFMGLYRPSSGTIYPRLAALEEEGLIMSHEHEGKRVYELTPAGREELTRRRAELEETFTSATTTVRTLVDELQADIRAAVAAVQSEVGRQAAPSGDAWRMMEDVRAAARDASREAKRVSEEARRAAREEAKRMRRMASDMRRHAGYERHDLDELANEVASWAQEAVDEVRRHLPDDGQRDRLRDALDAARRAFMDVFGGQEGSGEDTPDDEGPDLETWV